MSGRLDRAFFERPVHKVARELVGCTLKFGGAGGVIVETECYSGDDPACHAYNGLTDRNRVLFGPPGRAYVYRSYGIHNLLNAVSEPDGSPAAVLIRALEPTIGIDHMRRRRRRAQITELCSGPGKLTVALGIGIEQNGANLIGAPFELHAPDGEWRRVEVLAGPRIGISQAIDYPWRFCAGGSRFLSRPLRAS